MHGGERKQADGAGTGLAEQWLLPLTGNVSSPPGRDGRSWQTGAALTLREKDEWREQGRAKERKRRSRMETCTTNKENPEEIFSAKYFW